MKQIVLFFILGLLTCGCYEAGPDEDLRGVPVTNNPNLIPNGNTAQRPSLPY